MTIVLVGFIVGVCISYSGVGAGSLTTPLIILMLGYNASTAIGSDLLFSLGTKIVAFMTHVRAATIDYTALLFLSLGGVPGAIAGIAIVTWLHASLPLATVDHVLKLLLGAVLLISALVVAFTRSVKPGSEEPLPASARIPLAAIGAVVGVLVSVTSIGSGSLTLPLLMVVLSTAQLRRLIGTDIAFAVILLIPAIIGHWRLGDVNVNLAGLLLAGSVPGVLLGTLLVKRLPERVFRVGLATILVIVGARTI